MKSNNLFIFNYTKLCFCLQASEENGVPSELFNLCKLLKKREEGMTFSTLLASIQKTGDGEFLYLAMCLNVADAHCKARNCIMVRTKRPKSPLSAEKYGIYTAFIDARFCYYYWHFGRGWQAFWFANVQTSADKGCTRLRSKSHVRYMLSRKSKVLPLTVGSMWLRLHAVQTFRHLFAHSRT